MQSDFHHHTIKVLALNAGFSDPDASIIAFASQYTDDATEHKPIRVDKIPSCIAKLVGPKGNPLIFDPTCTAHSTLQYLAATKKDSQRKVYIPFHFIPNKPNTLGNGTFDYRVVQDGDIARALVKSAATELRDANRADEVGYTLALIRLGIALHSYADQWAHQMFSGRWNTENDVEEIQIAHGPGDTNWERISWWEQFKRNLLPDIGHAELISLPDHSGTDFAYVQARSGKRVVRVNRVLFFDAAAKIYEYLCFASKGQQTPWMSVGPKLTSCWTMDPSSVRLDLWRRTFPGVDFGYDPTLWRRQALGGMHVEWDRFDEEGFRALHYTATGDLKWFLFHIAASEQRKYVISQIRYDLG